MTLNRASKIGLGVALAVLLALAAAWAARAWLVAQFAERYFRQHGVAATVEIGALGLSGATGRFALGPSDAPELAAERLELFFDPLRWTPYLVEVRLVNQEMKVVFAARRAGDFQILRSDWIGDYLDPATFLDIFRGDSGNNYTGWNNADYDALLDAAARTADPAARFALFQKAEAILLSEAPLMPLYYHTHVFLIQPSVKGWHANLLDHHPYKHVWLEK